MSSIGTGYDLSASQFSPDGRVFQIEYASKAVENSGTAIGIRGKDGVVFAVEKIVTSKLFEKGANRRISNIDTHVGMAAAGLVTDARQLAEIARDEASTYRSDYGSPIPISHLTQRVSSYMHAYTLYSSIRPFGATIMLGTWAKETGAQMMCIEPSGVGYGFWGCAAGKAKSNAKTELEKLKMADLTCAELVKEAARIIYMVHDEVKDKMFELELSWVGEFTDGVHQRVPEKVHAEAEKFAKSAMEEDSDSDEDMS
eukprot:GFUD01041057.1.p1 GENE.GFUD01041057.1~~GFUD01041057.1.p1  ORF type:complete len:256 (-),score=100.28 GFUD01041057.1:73-840(-)